MKVPTGTLALIIIAFPSSARARRCGLPAAFKTKDACAGLHPVCAINWSATQLALDAIAGGIVGVLEVALRRKGERTKE